MHTHMEKKYFRKLVIAGFVKNVTLSFAGLIDCAIVGRYLGTDGLSAMKLAMPVFSFLSLFSAVFSTGLSITLSGELSEHGVKRARAVFKSAFFVICLIGAGITVLGFINPALLTDLLAGSSCEARVKVLTADYLKPILSGALPILLYDVLGTVAMLEGGTHFLKISSVALFVIDIIGDLLAVHLDLGMIGIASASTVSYTSAFLVILVFFFSKKTMFRPGFCLPDHAAVWKVLLLGIPVSVTLVCNILRPMSVNRFILSYGTNAGLAALSIQDSVRYVPGALCSGISSASLILAGIFSAESDRLAIRQEKWSIMRWSYIAGTFVAIVLMLVASPLLWLFTDDPSVHALGVPSLLFYLPGVPFIAINSSISSLFQGLGERWRSILYALFNRLILPILCACLLGKRFGDLGIYASFTVSEIILTAALITDLLIKKVRKKTIIPPILLNTEINVDLKTSIGSTEEAISASEQVNSLCLEHGVSSRKAYLISLTAEELMMNTLSHGFDDQKNHSLEFRFMITNNQLILRLRDDGRPFDLTERYKMINPEDPTHNIGLRIVFASADDVSYNSALNLNNVCIRIGKEDNPSGAALSASPA